MAKLTDEQMARGREHFLAGYPEIKQQIEALTEDQAEASCTTLGKLRIIETMKALEQAARAAGKDSHELFLSCIADTAEEFSALMATIGRQYR